MSVSIVSQPGLISLSKNPCEFHLRTDSWVNQQPVTGVYELSFTTKLTTLGSTLTLSWNGNTVVFFVQSPGVTPTGYNLPQDITATSLGQYVAALADTWFDAQYLLQKDFIIEYDGAGPLIRFTAREPGTELELSYSTTIPGGEATMATATLPGPWGFLDDYAIIMDIEVEETYGSGNYTRIGTLEGTPILYDDAGTWKGDVKVDVAELLDGFLQDRTDPPTPSSTTAFAADNTNLQWRAVWAERYSVGGEVVVTKRAQSTDKRVLKGGLKYVDVPALADLETDYYGAALAPFNTWQPSGKEVTAQQEHWLYFTTNYALAGAEAFRTVFTVYYTDGTSADTGLDDVTTQQQWETYAYNVGFEARGLDALQPTKTPYKYTVQIIEFLFGTAVSYETVTHTFWLVDETRQDRFFLYENSIGGGWETLLCNGDMEAVASVAKTEAANVVQAGYSATDAVVKQKSQGYADAFTVFTGYKTKAEAVHLREFINSENYYEIVNGVLIPIVVDGGSFQLEYDKTGEYAYGLSFKYRHAFINKGYSNA